MRVRELLIIFCSLVLVGTFGCAGVNLKKAEEHYQQGLHLMATNSYGKAIKQMEHAQTLGMEGIDFYYNLGVAYSYQRDKSKQAEMAYLRSIEFSAKASEKERTRFLPNAHYNLACLYALDHRNEEAFIHLFYAVTEGFRNYHLIKTDNELESLRAHPYFEQLESSIQNRVLPPPPHLPPIPAPPQQPPALLVPGE